GSGRLRRRRVEVTSTGRGIAGQHRAEVLLPQVNGALEAAPAVRSAPAVRGGDIAPTGTRLTPHSARSAGRWTPRPARRRRPARRGGGRPPGPGRSGAPRARDRARPPPSRPRWTRLPSP